MTWIAPNNTTLTAICGVSNGLGVNPIPTFVSYHSLGKLTPRIGTSSVGERLRTPFSPSPHSSLARSALCSCKLTPLRTTNARIIIFWWTNAFNTAYLPINSNRTFDNTGAKYNVSRVLDAKGNLDFAKYNEYSEAWMSAGNLVVYVAFFGSFSLPS